MVIKLNGRIDSGNAGRIEGYIREQLGETASEPVKLDFQEVSYISSAGLRIILQIRKYCPQLSLVNVNREIYSIMQMTGFTEIMPVEKAYSVISLEGCEVIGEGANGKIYRYRDDCIVKLYKNPDSLEEINYQRENARLALILGIPTAIAYDVVRVGDNYGSVYELLNAESLSKILARDPGRLEWCVRESADMLKKLHSTHVPEGRLPSARQLAMQWARRMLDVLPEDLAVKLMRMEEAIPETDTLIHGDFHTGNLLLTGDEVLLIDMDTLAVGDPVFELAQMFCTFRGFGEQDPAVVSDYLGYDASLAAGFWRKILESYLGEGDEDRIARIEDRARCIAYTRLIDWSRRHRGDGEETDREARKKWAAELADLLERVDCLAVSGS